MKRLVVFVLFALFSTFLSAQSVEEICFRVNEYAKNLHSAYYETKVSLNNGVDTVSYFHKVSFKKNKSRNKVFAMFNAQIFSSNELIKQVFCDNNRFTFVDFYENIAEQYEKEDYETFVNQINFEVIPDFVFNKPIFDFKAIEKGDVKITRGNDTIINGFEVFHLYEALLKFDTVSYLKEHYIRKKDFLPLAKYTTIFLLDLETAEISAKNYYVELTRIDENAAFLDERFVFDDRNTGIDLRHKSLSALKRQWNEQEINQSTFAYRTPALNFKISDTYGRDFELKQNKGKVVVLVFFYNNCSPCIPMLDDLQELSEIFKGKGVEFVALNPVDTKINNDEMQSFVKEHKLSYYVAQIPKYTVEEMYLVRYFPTIFIIDKKGKVIFSHQGYNSLFKDKISRIINRKL